MFKIPKFVSKSKVHSEVCFMLCSRLYRAWVTPTTPKTNCRLAQHMLMLSALMLGLVPSSQSFASTIDTMSS